MQRTAIIVVSVVAVLATGGVIAASGGAQSPGGQTIKLVTKNFKFGFADHPPKIRGRNGAPGITDAFAFNAVATKPDGTRVGRLDASGTTTAGGRNGRGVGYGVYRLTGQGEIHVIVGFSTKESDGSTTVGSVVGGTGAFVGARGSLTSVDRRGEAGGDPSDDTITLLP